MNREPPRALQPEELFREMADNIRDVFWVRAADTGRVLFVSPAYESIWGQPPDALLAEGGRWPDGVLAEDRAAVEAAAARLAGGAPAEVEYRIRRPDAAVRWILDRGFPVPAADGGVTRVVGVAADITERRRLESELLQSQKMEMVGKLAGGIGHDFNNLLTIISGYVSILLEKEDLPPASAEALKRVFTASNQAAALVRQLVLFSRKRAPKPEVVDLNVEIESIAGILQRLLGETIAVDFVPAPETPRVNVDVAMLEQVLMNLAVNARDAMRRGGRLTITVSVRPVGGPPPPSPAPDGPYACIAVRDTGAGIAAAILPRIFEPFFTTKEEGRGTGLGLATARDIVKRHEGWLDVETQIGTGTVFRVYLPRVTSGLTSTPPFSEVHDVRRGKGVVLLVEDEANVREFAAAVLQQDGYSVLQAGSADAALEAWQWHGERVDVLLTDVVLPGELSGVDLAAALRELKPGLKAILTTGYSRDVVVPDGTAALLPVLTKPYTPRMLLQAVDDALR